MSDLIKKILVALAATVGFFAVVVAILYFLGVDLPCPCACRKPAKEGAVKTAKVKRHYTLLDLPED